VNAAPKKRSLVDFLQDSSDYNSWAERIEEDFPIMPRATDEHRRPGYGDREMFDPFNRGERLIDAVGWLHRPGEELSPATGPQHLFGDRDGFDDPSSESRYRPREELPLPTAPPYTAFVGNLAFDIREEEIEEFFGSKLKSVKIIKDRDDKSKGRGFVEFETLQGLKDGLTKSGTQLTSRAVRISVARPPKEREGRGGGRDDDTSRDPAGPSSDRRGFRSGAADGGSR